MIPELTNFELAIKANTEGLTAVSTGACPGCGTCQKLYEYDSQEAFDKAYKAGKVVHEPHFSHHGCDLCGSPLDGDDEAAMRAELERWERSDTCAHVEVSLDNMGRLDSESAPRPA